MPFARSLALASIACLLAGTAAAEIAEDSVKIGVLTDMSSPFAALGGEGSVVAARMAARDFGGKVAGKAIDIIAADHLNKPDVGANIARQWFDQDHVDAIVDVPNSAVALAVQEVARERGKIVLFSGPASDDLTGKACSPTGVHWTYDAYAMAHGTAGALVKEGGDSWFFLTTDDASGHALERDAALSVTAAGGTVSGSAKVPPGTADLPSFLQRAQSSKAKVIGLAEGESEAFEAVKQAAPLGIAAHGQRLAGFLLFISDVERLGLEAAQGLVLASAFYWDQNEATRAWSERFMAEAKNVPTMVQAGVYGAVTHYLKAVEAAKSVEGKTVVGEMREIPINDMMTTNGKLLQDGRVMREMYLYEVKSPAESKGPHDFYKQLAAVPAEAAFRPLAASACPLVSKG